MHDGTLMLVPKFKRARRSESREATVAYSRRMEGERRCAILLNMLDRMEEVNKKENWAIPLVFFSRAWPFTVFESSF